MRKLFAVLTTFSLLLGLLPAAVLAQEHSCADADHDHLCDECASPAYQLDEEWRCDAPDCDAREVSITGDYVALNYHTKDGRSVVDAQAEIAAEIRDLDCYLDDLPFPPAQGTVTVCFEDEEYTRHDEYTIENIPLIDGTCLVTVNELPVELLNYARLFYSPADSMATMPAENGMTLEFQDNAYQVHVSAPFPFTINGVEESRIRLLAGSEVTILPEMDAAGSVEWVFDEDETVPEYRQEGNSILFDMPEGDVDVEMVFTCETCEPGDSHWCDVCGSRLSVCEDGDHDYLCDCCGGPCYPGAGEMEPEMEVGDGQVTITWQPMPEQVGDEVLLRYELFGCAEDESEQLEDIVIPAAECAFTYTYSGLTNDKVYCMGITACYGAPDAQEDDIYTATYLFDVIPVSAEATAPGMPRITNVTFDEGVINVFWIAPESDGGARVREYEISLEQESEDGIWGLTHGLEAGEGTMSFTLEGENLIPGTTYQISISAKNAVDWGEASCSEVYYPLIPYTVEVGGVRITEENMADVLEDGGAVSFDHENRVLTLNNADIAVTSGNYGIHTRVPLTIKLVGENKVSCSGYYGLLARNALVICGEGKLDISGSDFGIYTINYPDATLTVCDSVTVNASAGDVVSGGSFGIRADGVFTVRDNAAVTALAGKAPGRSCGIYAYTRLNVEDNANVTTTGGIAGADSYGIRTTDITVSGGTLNAHGGAGLLESNGIYVQGMEILGGTVNVSGATTDGAPSRGLLVTGDLTVSGQTTTLNARGGNAAGDASHGIYVGADMLVENGTVIAQSGISGYTYGIEADTLTVNGGSITAQAANSDDMEEGYSWGIQSYNALELNGGSIHAVGGNAGFRSYGVQVSGPAHFNAGTLYAACGNAVKCYGLWSMEEPAMADELTFHIPGNGELDNSGEWYWFVSANGQAATQVQIGPVQHEEDSSDSGSSGASSHSRPSKPPVVVPAKTFSDVSADTWYLDAVNYVASRGLMVGVGEDTFAPMEITSRATLAAILWNHAGKPAAKDAVNFTDLPADGWYTEAVRWAAAEGLTSGYEDGRFGASDPLTREQLAAMLYRYEQSRGGGFSGAWMFLLRYDDTAQISDWAYEPMCWMTMKGVIGGKGNNMLDPAGAATRAEIAQILMKYLEL